MNDPTEIVEGIRLLIDVILDLADKYKGRTEILNRLGTCYYHTVRAFSHYSRHTSENLEKFGMSNDQAKLSVFVDRFAQPSEDELKKVRVVYMTSLCEKPDSIDLWRPYGDDGRGITIGVDSSALQRMKLPGRSEEGSRSYPLFLLKVLYDRSRYERSVRKQLQKMIDSIASPDAVNLIETCEQLFKLVVCYKDHHYTSEREWRLFVYAKRYYHTPEFDHTSNQPRPYLKSPSIDPICFKEVATGPCSPFDCEQDDAWKHYLSSVCKLDLEEMNLQHLNSIPYRRR